MRCAFCRRMEFTGREITVVAYPGPAAARLCSWGCLAGWAVRQTGRVMPDDDATRPDSPPDSPPDQTGST
jgi:hypothetical protein